MSDDLAAWSPRQRPETLFAEGRHVSVERIVDDRRFEELYDAYRADAAGDLYAWLPYGPFDNRADFMDFARRTYIDGETCFYAIVPASSGRAEGVAALMRTDTVMGVTEIGHICLAPSLQRTPAATEAFALLMTYVFDELGYRRFEWKCDNGNGPSKRAAARLGFVEEGLFRQHMVVKGRNRDTAWFSILDSEWPLLRHAFTRWLDPANFDVANCQIASLSELRG